VSKRTRLKRSEGGRTPEGRLGHRGLARDVSGTL
jgi:hypothetical protein